MDDVVSYKEAVEWAKKWKAPKCEDKNCICNIKKVDDSNSPFSVTGAQKPHELQDGKFDSSKGDSR